jgi:hypothetical protein
MKIPKYVQRSRKKGARLPPRTLCCTRPGKLGNPFKIGSYLGKKILITPEISFLLYNDCVDAIFDNAGMEPSELLNYDYLACWCPIGTLHCHVQSCLIPLLKERYGH